MSGLLEGIIWGFKLVKYELWVLMDYGLIMMGIFEIGKDVKNFVYKGIVVCLNLGFGGVFKGLYWMFYDYDMMCVVGVWIGREFIDWNGIYFNGCYVIYLCVVGDVIIENLIVFGWVDLVIGLFEDF